MSSAFLCPVGKRLLFSKPYKLKHMKTINFLKTALLTIALFVCGNVGAETITISKAAIPDLTMEASEHTFSINDIEFISKLKYSGDNLFFTSGSDYLYNTTSLGTINSITIYYGTGGSNKAYQYFSSGDIAISGYQSGTAQLTSSTPGESGIYSTFNGGFFNLSISNKNLQASSIVIDYTPTTTTPTEVYTVTFDAGTGTCETTSLTETTPGAGITLPTATSPCPENWTFVGWAKENVAETTTAPTLFSANSEYKPTAHETLYAVYTQEEEGQNPNEFKLSLIYEENTYYISETITSNKLEAVTSVDNAAIFGIEEATGGKYYVYFYQDGTKTYVAGVKDKTNLSISTTASQMWTITNNENTISFESPFSRFLGFNYNNGSPRFSHYASNLAHDLTKTPVMGLINTYSTNPDCSAITVAAPTFNVEAGTYYEPKNVTITAEEGATIYYTINGDEPDETSSQYTNNTPIEITTSTTLKAIAVIDGYSSFTTSATYVIKAQTPTFSISGGKFLEAQEITISCGTPNATIFYTTDNTDPAESETAIEYTNGATIEITNTTTIKAVAMDENTNLSDVANATYTIITIQPNTTIASFLESEESDEIYYELTGTISNIVDTEYGNFDLTDETGTIYVYGLTATFKTSNDKSFASLNLTNGDVITIRGTRASYREDAQVGGPAYFINKVERLEKPVVSEATSITSTSFTANWQAVDNATSYEVNVWTENIVEPTGEKGSPTNPYTVDEYIAAENVSNPVSVMGYMAGFVVNDGYVTTISSNNNTNFALASETGANKTFVPVELPSAGTIRTEWGLGNNPDRLNALVVVTATREKYFSNNNGLKATSSISNYPIIEATPIANSPFTATETSKEITGLAAETTYYYNVVAKSEGYTASEASNTISVITSNSTGTGLCNQPEMEGITFNGEEIINSLNLDVVVYNAVGQMVVRSNENINMSSYPAGVYVIKAANGESMKIVK